ncbi:expressed unknown protein [Seminavis robusta]|uniref:Uncharacterized protein n=1 Tax=Seminavis robusta TaxID=568900 RepID=A0A9N8DE44_9STRA|nr:expressed unknown protein [Seminavis robusta]|eukprot:Sro112_g055810.1 n/a (101) ;mRNA; f:90217-90519
MMMTFMSERRENRPLRGESWADFHNTYSNHDKSKVFGVQAAAESGIVHRLLSIGADKQQQQQQKTLNKRNSSGKRLFRSSGSPPKGNIKFGVVSHRRQSC